LANTNAEGNEDEVKTETVGPQFININVQEDKEVLVNKTICEIDPFCPRVDNNEHIVTNAD